MIHMPTCYTNTVSAGSAFSNYLSFHKFIHTHKVLWMIYISFVPLILKLLILASHVLRLLFKHPLFNVSTFFNHNRHLSLKVMH